MFHFRLTRGVTRAALLVLLSCFFTTVFAADRFGGHKSASAGIFLRAVLLQSLSISAAPHPGMFDSFVQSTSTEAPVTFKANWVRGPGVISVVVFSSKEWTGFDTGAEPALSVPGSVTSPAMEFESGKLPFSADSKNEVLTVRAQVI